MPDDPLTNPDRDDKHDRRRKAGDEDDDLDGREVADALYGGIAPGPVPTSPNTNKDHSDDTRQQEEGE